MKEYPEFGKCLSLLISALNIKNNRLARALNVDPSLVSRWVNGKRVPSHRTQYIEMISSFLASSTLNSFQKKHLNDILQSIDDSLDDNMQLQEKIERVLLESQGYSIEKAKLKCQVKTHYKETLGKKNTDNIIKSSDDTIESYVTCLSNEDQIITGVENLLFTGLNLMEAAAHQLDNCNATIYISFSNWIDIVCDRDEFHHKYVKALLAAIKNGWSVIFIIRINNDLDKAFNILQFTQPLFITGRFNIYYFKNYDYTSTKKETIAIPGIGVLSCFPVKPESGNSYAFLFRNPTAVEFITNYIINEILPNTMPLLKYHQKENKIELMNNYIKLEETPGKKISYMDCLNMLFFSSTAYERYLDIDNQLDVFNKKKSCYKKRLDSFYKNIFFYGQMDIFTRESIVNFISTGRFRLGNCCHTQSLKAPIHHIANYINNIIVHLERFDKYEAALISSNKYDKFANTCIAMKDFQSVHMEIWSNHGATPQTYLSIYEPTMIRGYKEGFSKMWNQISPIEKDKNSVIAWLKAQIQLLPSHNTLL